MAVDTFRFVRNHPVKVAVIMMYFVGALALADPAADTSVFVPDYFVTRIDLPNWHGSSLQCYDDRFPAAGRPDIFGIRANGTDGAFFAGNVYDVFFFGDNHRAELEPVVKGHQPAFKAEQN